MLLLHNTIYRIQTFYKSSCNLAEYKLREKQLAVNNHELKKQIEMSAYSLKFNYTLYRANVHILLYSKYATESNALTACCIHYLMLQI